MKKTVFILAVCMAFAFAGCSAGQEPPAQSGPAQNLPDAGAQAPNVWVVKGEAPVVDADTQKEAGRAFEGFMLSLESEKDGRAYFSLSFMDETGQNVSETKNYAIDTQFMEKKYAEPQAVILMISTDMFRLRAGGSLYDAQGSRLITFNDAVGPFYYIQKTENGYMMTLDFNVVYAKEADAEFIPLAVQQ